MKFLGILIVAAVILAVAVFVFWCVGKAIDWFMDWEGS